MNKKEEIAKELSVLVRLGLPEAKRALEQLRSGKFDREIEKADNMGVGETAELLMNLSGISGSKSKQEAQMFDISKILTDQEVSFLADLEVEDYPRSVEIQAALESLGEEKSIHMFMAEMINGGGISESLKSACMILAGQKEIEHLVASNQLMAKANEAAMALAPMVNGQWETIAGPANHLKASSFFTYPLNGKLMGALIVAYADGSYGLGKAPYMAFKSTQDAIEGLSNRIMASYEPGIKFEAIAEDLEEEVSDGETHTDGVHKIKVYYEIVTEESAKEGDYSETGEDSEKIFTEADVTAEDGESFATAAAKFLKSEGVTMASSSEFHEGVWYEVEGQMDPQSGETKSFSFHLEGYTPEEEKEVWNLMGVGPKVGEEVEGAKKEEKKEKWVYKSHQGKKLMCSASKARMQFYAKTPKGFEKVVKELKNNPEAKNPWAIAWSMKDKGIKPKASLVKADFMQKELFEMDGAEIDMEDGSTEFLPADVYSRTNDNSTPPTVEDVADYCEGTPKEVTPIHGWWGRYSAPGYLDHTDWVFDVDKKACEEELQLLFGNDEEELEEEQGIEGKSKSDPDGEKRFPSNFTNHDQAPDGKRPGGFKNKRDSDAYLELIKSWKQRDKDHAAQKAAGYHKEEGLEGKKKIIKADQIEESFATVPMLNEDKVIDVWTGKPWTPRPKPQLTPVSEGNSDAPVSRDLLPPGVLDAQEKASIIERPAANGNQTFPDQTPKLKDDSIGTITFDTEKGSMAVA